jgi:hypothetical protein
MWIDGLGWQGFSLLIILNNNIFCFALLIGLLCGSAENTPVCRKMGGDECAGVRGLWKGAMGMVLSGSGAVYGEGVRKFS